MPQLNYLLLFHFLWCMIDHNSKENNSTENKGRKYFLTENNAIKHFKGIQFHENFF